MVVGLARRVVNIAGLLLAVLVLNFLLIHTAPGDPVDVIAGEMGGAEPHVIEQLRESYGLTRPLSVQLATYLGKVLQGDFGRSYYFNQPVTALILQRLPATVLLVATSVLLALLVGTLLGIFSARRPRSPLSHFVTGLSLAGYSAPVFWTGILLILCFSLYIPILPAGGMNDVSRQASGLAYAADVAAHLVLPALTLASTYVAQYSRLSRTSMIDALRADYTRTARAKGASEFSVLFKHALRNALIPIVTIVGLQFSQVLAGAVMVETVFNWPGMGRLVLESILRRDYPTLLGILFFSALLVMVANLITDLCYRLVDPRISTAHDG